jgi:hypothetical protein
MAVLSPSAIYRKVLTGRRGSTGTLPMWSSPWGLVSYVLK